MGAQAAETILSRIAGEEPVPLNQAFTGQCISLGRRAGTIQLARFDDSVLPLHLGGRLAAGPRPGGRRRRAGPAAAAEHLGADRARPGGLARPGRVARHRTAR